MRADRLALLLALSTFLFVGGLRAFLSGVYYDNLVALELGPSALWSLALLAPVLFLLPPLARAHRAVLLASALALALARVALPFARGTPFGVPLAGAAAASWLLLLGALVPLLRPTHLAPAAAGIAVGWALDVALVWWGDSADPTQPLRGLLLVLPTALLLAWTAWTLARGEMRAEPRAGGWAAGAALGVWLFVQHTLAANPYGAARWNELAPRATALASVAGLLIGALLVVRVPRWPRAALVALHALALLALVDHSLLHSPALPLLLALLQVALVVDLALLLPRLTPRALALAGLVALLLHFVYAFTFLFAFVPLGALWEGQAPTLYVLAGLALAALALLPPTWRAIDARARRPYTSLLLVPALIAAVAAASPAAHVPEPDAELRVLSFNVHQGFSNAGVVDPEPFLRVLREADADIVALQEADSARFTSANIDMAGLLAERAGYHLVYGQPTRAQAFGGAILTRYPVLEAHVAQLPSTSDDRWYTSARLDVGGASVWVHAVHFALPHEGRTAQAAVLAARVDGTQGPQLLIGDLNSCPSGLCPGYEEGVPDDVYATMTARLQDAWVAAGHARDDPAGFTYNAFAPTERIDHVYASAHFRVVSAQVVRSDAALAASDHLPVLTVLELR